jgi:copper chaperone CopZ
MDLHTVTVQFDDEQTAVSDIITALSKAGYSVPEHKAID